MGYLVAEPPHYLSVCVYTYGVYTYARGHSLMIFDLDCAVSLAAHKPKPNPDGTAPPSK